MAHIVKCRICKQEFDTEKLAKEAWVLPSPRYYYHTNCYEDWKANRNNLRSGEKNESFWFEALVDYLYRDVKMSVDFPKLKSQWNNFLKPNRSMTPKGIFFTIKYYYDILHGDKAKALGGIGIVTSIYNQAAQYWTELEHRKIGTIEAIIEQIKSREQRPVQKKIVKTESKDKSKFNLEEI